MGAKEFVQNSNSVAHSSKFAVRIFYMGAKERQKRETVKKLKGSNGMAIIVNLDVMMAKRKMGLTELADKVGITLANLSILKNNRARAVRFSTLDAICKALDCQPADLLEWVPDQPEEQ